MSKDLTATDRKERLERAQEIVKNHAFGAVLAGAVPIPAVDLVILAGIQLKMVKALTELFETKFQRSVAKAVISSLVGSAAAASVVTPLTSLVKIVPGVGLFAGAVTTGGLGSAATYAVGRVFIGHFDSGGTILSLDPEKVRKYYEEQTKEAPKAVERGMP